MTAADSSLTIGKAARLAGTGVETIHFYERERLIENPSRNVSSYRLSPPETVARVLFTRCAKNLGFTLKELKDLLSLRVDSRTIAGQKGQQSMLACIEREIAEPKKTRNSLETLNSACQEYLAATECPIPDYLESNIQNNE